MGKNALVAVVSAHNKRVTKKCFGHPPADFLTPADLRLRPLLGVSRAHARSLTGLFSQPLVIVIRDYNKSIFTR